jgi:hypothetical protein
MNCVLFLILSFIFVVPGFAQEPEDEVEWALKERQEREKRESMATSSARASHEFELFEKLKKSSILDKKVQELLQKTLAEAKLWEKKPEDIRKMIEEGAKGEYTEKIFKTFPKLLDLSVNMLKDKEAMPQLIKILSKNQLLEQYGIILFIMMLGLWLVKKYIFPPEPNLLRQAFTDLCFVLTASACSIGLFYIFFIEEVSPTVTVLARTFLT